VQQAVMMHPYGPDTVLDKAGAPAEWHGAEKQD